VKTLLSTKILSPSQKELLLNAGMGFVEYDAIQIKFLDVSYPKAVECAIVTSQNAVQFILEKDIKVSQCYCVGDKTEALLIQNGQKVIKKAENSGDLAQFLSKTKQNDPFIYFCGTLRRDEIPSVLQREKVPFQEIVCYETTFQKKVFQQPWDGILFYSPSGVESFFGCNVPGDSIAFCIGDTTATAVKKYTENIVVASSARVESVIAKAVKTLNHHD
jgi:uroporphyrinogen-III synthase